MSTKRKRHDNDKLFHMGDADNDSNNKRSHCKNKQLQQQYNKQVHFDSNIQLSSMSTPNCVRGVTEVGKPVSTKLGNDNYQLAFHLKMV